MLGRSTPGQPPCLLPATTIQEVLKAADVGPSTAAGAAGPPGQELEAPERQQTVWHECAHLSQEPLVPQASTPIRVASSPSPSTSGPPVEQTAQVAGFESGKVG